VLPKSQPPVWMAATSTGAIDRAAANGFSILMDPHSSRADLIRKRRHYGEKLVTASHSDTGRTIPMARLIAAEKASEVARRAAQWIVASYVGPVSTFCYKLLRSFKKIGQVDRNRYAMYVGRVYVSFTYSGLRADGGIIRSDSISLARGYEIAETRLYLEKVATSVPLRSTPQNPSAPWPLRSNACRGSSSSQARSPSRTAVSARRSSSRAPTGALSSTFRICGIRCGNTLRP
jgi:hypothetical protein